MFEHDIELTRTEAELLRQETTLQTELDRLEVTRVELAERLASLARQVADAKAAGEEDAALDQRLSALSLVAPDGESCRALARAKRHEAVVARRRANAELEKLIGAWRSEYGQAGRALVEADGVVQVLARRAATKALEREARNQAAPAIVPLVPRSPVPGSDERKGRAARINQRVPMQAAIDLHSDDNFFTGFSANLSDGGVFVATVNLLPLGTEVDLAFTLPTGQKIEAKGEVRWVRDVNDGDPEQFPGLGVQFTALPNEAEAAIHRFVQEREPLFYAAA